MGMVEGSDDFGFSEEAVFERLVFHVFAFEDFERDSLPRIFGTGFVDAPHAAFSDERSRDILTADERSQELIAWTFAPL